MKEWTIPKRGASRTQRREITRKFLDTPVSRTSYVGLEFIADNGIQTHIIRKTRTKKWLCFTISNESVYRRGIKSVLENQGTVKVGAILPRRRW